MKDLSITFIFLCIAAIGFSQQIHLSKEQQIRNEDNYEVLGKVGESVFLLKERADMYEIQAYDKDLKQTWTKKLRLDHSRAKIISTLTRKNELLVAYRFKHKGRMNIKLHKYDSELELTDSVTIKVYSKRSFSPKPEALLSKNKQKILFYHLERSEQLEAFVFDVGNMKILWDKDFPVNIAQTYRQNFYQILVDDLGGIHFIIEKNNRKNKIKENHFKVIHYNASIKEPLNYKIAMKDQLWYDVDFIYDNINQRLIAGGLIANKKQSEATGFFYLNIDPKNPDGLTFSTEDFDPKFIKNIVGRRGKKTGFADATIQETVLRRDGGVLIITERNRKFVRQVGGSALSGGFPGEEYDNSQVDYHYNDIVLVSVHPTGQLHWKEILPKRQFSQDDNAYFSSYFLLKTPRSLRFLYNDEIRVENNVNEYVVSGKGDPQRKSILNTNTDKLMLVLRNALQISPSEVIIPSERKRQLRLVKFVY